MFTKQQETLAENELWEMDEARLSGFDSILVESNSAQRDGLNKLNAENAEIKKDKIRFNDIQEALRLARDIKERFEGPSQGRGVSVNQKKHANHMMRLRSEIINEAYKQSKKKNVNETKAKTLSSVSPSNVEDKVKNFLKQISDSFKFMRTDVIDDNRVEVEFEADDPSIEDPDELDRHLDNVIDKVEKLVESQPNMSIEGNIKKSEEVNLTVTLFIDEPLWTEKVNFREDVKRDESSDKDINESTNIQESEAQVLDDLQRFLEDYFGEEVRLWSQGDAAKAQISGLMGDGWDADMIEANAQELHREQAFQQIISGVYEFNGAVHDEDSDILTLYFRVL